MRRVAALLLLIAGLLGSAPLRAQSAMLDGDLVVLCYHEVTAAGAGRKGVHSVSVQTLASHLAWIRRAGYTPVSLEQVVHSRRGGPALPPRAVLLSFDDGYRSFYTEVWPLLRLYRTPAVLAVVGSWLETPYGATVRYGEEEVPRERFLSWDQIRQMNESGLVEVASHTWDLHRAIPANFAGNTQPAATTRRFEEGRHESLAAWRERIRDDLDRNSRLIARELGARPRAIVWPFGEWNGELVDLARELGMSVAFTLDDGFLKQSAGLSAVPRILVENEAKLDALIWNLRHLGTQTAQRLIEIDLAELQHPSLEEREARLGQLLDRLVRLKPGAVVLRAWTDEDGDGEPDGAWFENTVLPVKADLLNRVASRLFNRVGVRVLLRLPLPGRTLGRADLEQLYAQMAAQVPFHGLWFEGEGAPDPVVSAPLRAAALRMRAPLRAVVALGLDRDADSPTPSARLLEQVRAVLARGDLVALRVGPGFDRTRLTQAVRELLGHVTGSVNADAAARVAFVLRSGEGSDADAAARELVRDLQVVLAAGGVSVGYAPRSVLGDHPRGAVVRPAFSLRSDRD